MADIVRLTVVGSQFEADLISSMLRSEGIRCLDRPADVSGEQPAGLGGWRELLVGEVDVGRARELLAAR